jgi:transposase
MDRRLHSMPFRKIQSTISYKSVERGYKPETVPKHARYVAN